MLMDGHPPIREEPTASNHGQDLYLLSDNIVRTITHVVDGSGVFISADTFGGIIRCAP